MSDLLHIAVACGGTGGHFFPGVAVARQLRDKGHRVTLWLSGREPEETVRQAWGDGPTVVVPASGMSGLSLRSVRSSLSLVTAFIRAYRLMKRNTPDVLLGMGSYAIVGPVLAANRLKIPVVLHEANAIPGRAISLLSRAASCVALTFPMSASYFKGRRTYPTGIPIRELIAGPLPPGGTIDNTRPIVLVMGGSQGASFINETASQALCKLHQKGIAFSVIHLSGPKDLPTIKRRYESAGVPALTLSFLHEMGAAYSRATLAISRSGASSCMELAAWKIPALFIPLPSARRDHQRVNADAMAQGGGAIVLNQETLTVAQLDTQLTSLLTDAGALDRMKSRVDDSLASDATTRVAELILREAQHANL